MITLIASLKFKPDEGSKFEVEFPAIAARVKAEESGVLAYKLCRIRGSKDRYRMVEIYDSTEALDQHIDKTRQSPTNLLELLTEPPEIEILDDVPGSVQPH